MRPSGIPRGSPHGKKQVQISAHCSDYCHALCNPFDAKPAGLPTFPSLPTLKQKVFAIGTAYTGSAGVGFVAARPEAAAVNDVTNVWYSTAAYGGTTIDTVAAGVNTANSNAMFTAAEISDDLTTYRIVGCGLRVRYGGTELNRGGFKVCLVDPTHRTLAGRDEASFNSELQTKRVGITRSWTTLVYRPVAVNDVNFRASSPTSDNPYMAALIISPDNAINELFEWECFTIVEYQGANARGQTHTDPDPIGYAAVSAVANKTNSVFTQSASKSAAEMHEAVGHYIAHGISGVNDVVAGASQAIQTASSVASTASRAWSIFEDAFSIAAPLLAFI